MSLTVAERSRSFHARRRASAEAEQRRAYVERRAQLGREKVGTLAHFRRWVARLRLDNGKHFILEPAQSSFVRDLFQGRPENWFVVPEGNAKTTLVAAIGLYGLEFYLDAAIPLGASARDQAGLLFDQMEGFIERGKDDELEDIAGFEVHPGYRRIDYVQNRSFARVFAADDATADGIIPYPFALIDELHRHRDLRLYRTWRGKLHKRGAQLITISTSGEPGGEFEQTRERIRQRATEVTRKRAFIRAVSPEVLLHEWAVPEGADVEDLRIVKQANPLRAITVAMLRSKLDSPTMTMAHWRRFVCNVPTRADSAGISEVEWAKARTTEVIPEGIPIWVGLDVAWKWDTTAIVPYWLRDDDFQLLGPAEVLVPPRDGQSLDPHAIERALTTLHARNPIHTVVMDPSRAEQLGAWIYETFGSTVIERGQSPSLAVVDYDKFMEGLRTGKLHHSGDQALTEHALNAIARVDRFGAARFDRSTPVRNVASEQAKRVIDALTAAAMVHAQAMVEEPAPVYAGERGLVEIG